jgi:hypothetical protein
VARLARLAVKSRSARREQHATCTRLYITSLSTIPRGTNAFLVVALLLLTTRLSNVLGSLHVMVRSTSHVLPLSNNKNKSRSRNPAVSKHTCTSWSWLSIEQQADIEVFPCAILRCHICHLGLEQHTLHRIALHDVKSVPNGATVRPATL